jgi:type I restriction enzyme, S subunit
LDLKSKTIQEFKETEIGKIPADWELESLGKYCTLFVPMRNKPKKFDGHIPWIRIEDLNGKYVSNSKSNRHVTSKIINEMNLRVLPIGTILCSCTATIGICAIIQKELVTNQQFIGIQTTDMNNEFLYYFLLTQTNNLKNNAFGSVAGYITRKRFEELKIICPPINEQKFIVKVLSDLDAKIQNLQNQNRVLEQMAQAIFQSWFVDFDGVTEWDDSELGKIPKGWQVGTFLDVIAELESGRRPKGGINSSDTEIPSIGAENIIGLGKYNYLKTKFVSSDFFNVMKDGKIKENDVLLYKDGASLGRSSLFRNGFPFQKCCINEHVFILRPSEKISSSFLFFWIDQDFMKQEIINLNSNSAQPGINKPGVLSLPILIPEININKKFRILIEPLLTKFFKNILNCNQLTKTRDTLLPKLMSGEIRV